LEGRHGIRGAAAVQTPAPASMPINLRQAREVLASAESGIQGGDSSLRRVASAIRLEIAIAEAEDATPLGSPTEHLDPLFRLRIRRWAMVDGDLAALVPVRDPQLRMMTFDVSELLAGQTEQGFPAVRTPRPRHVVAFAQANGERREPLFVSDRTARIIELSDGTRTALEIAKEIGLGNRRAGTGQGLRQIEELFMSGLLWLHEGQIERIESIRSNPMQSA
jgi:hypothetical protein